MTRNFSLVRVNGNYTEWSNWTTCSETCGSIYAVETRRRSCSNPYPRNHGLDCIQQSMGPPDESRPCGRDPCPGLEMYFLKDVFPLYVNFQILFGVNIRDF